MRKELQEKLFNDFPMLYKQRTLPITYSSMPFGIETGDGWYNLIYELSGKITQLNPNIEAVQVKEKFGQLCFYVANATDNVWDVIEEAENKSSSICENCGNAGNVSHDNTGWIYTLCDHCREMQKLEK